MYLFYLEHFMLPAHPASGHRDDYHSKQALKTSNLSASIFKIKNKNIDEKEVTRPVVALRSGPF